MRNLSVLKTFLLPFLVAVLVLPNFSALSQEECETREECEALLKQYEQDIKKLEEVIGTTAQEKKTLQNQISILKQKIEKLNFQIRQSNIMIKDVSWQIKDTEGSIENTSLKIEDSRQKLADILKLIYEEDQKSLLEILLSEPNLSDFFNNLMALETLNTQSQELLENIKSLKTNLEGQKQSLDEEKEDLERIAKIQALQKQESEATKKDQEYFLKLTEAQYQKYLKEKAEVEKEAARIRARIFELIGVPEAPTFGQALDFAKEVEKITGVRPAFLLAVLQQESAIGKNVGQCYLKDTASGDGIRINTGQKLSRVMSPKRDVPPFLTITKDLERDPFSTPVSCPMSVGWGGAMGPAQFIPSTWANPRSSPTGTSYRDRVSAIVGKGADPWNIRDAFFAAGLYLTDYGAKSQTRDGEWRAAMIYFSGSTNSQFSWYANNVLKIADGFQKDIELLEKSK